MDVRTAWDCAGNQGNGHSLAGVMSADGRYVAFVSEASNLVVGDTNGLGDVFVHDRDTGLTERVSVDSNGTQGNKYCFSPAISADGRYVAFASWASNLVVGDTNGCVDYFVHDRQTGATERVSVDSDGNQGNEPDPDPDATSISADGRLVAFSSRAPFVPADSNYEYDVFVHDRDTGITERVSVDSAGNQGNGNSGHPVISADGRYVAFASDASNLAVGDTNGFRDVFVHDRDTGVTERVSVDSAGNQANQGSGPTGEVAISADGRYVAFQSIASNLVPDDTNGRDDNFVHDRQTGTTERVSVDSNGTQGNDNSWSPAISADGRYVALSSSASNLVVGDTNGCVDIFVHDRQTGATERVSVDGAGNQVDGGGGRSDISPDGRYVAFESGASNLVPDDTNGYADIFVHDRQTGPEPTPVPVGGIAELPDVSGASGPNYVALAGLAAAALVALTAGAWYAKRRWMP